MKIAQLAEPASMSAPLKRSLKATSTKSILKSAPTAEHAPMYARWKQSIPSKIRAIRKELRLL